MKMRLSFVTNSSSSSFIVAFASMPQTVEDVYKALFPDGEEVFVGDLCNGIPTMDIATQIFKDLKPQQPQTLKSLNERFKEINDDDAPQYSFSSGFRYGSPEYNEMMKKFNHDMERYTKATLKRFVDANKGGAIYIFEYGNDSKNHTPIKTDMENTDLYKNVPFIRISHH